MASQTVQGKGFEYACLLSLYERMASHQAVEVVDSPACRQARKAYESLGEEARASMDQGARAAIRALCRLEPQLEDPGDNTPLILMIQSDQRGTTGDVRDILAIRERNNWEIGISVKHNHAAVKHSRLSRTIDFGSSWLGIPCSNAYFEEVEPIFQELVTLREQDLRWSELESKAQRFYVPILEAFKNEMMRLYRTHGAAVPQELLRYLLGRHDFYKMITDTRNRVTKVQAFSLNGTLNRPSGRLRPIYRVPSLRLPTIIHSIGFKPGSQTTINIVCNEGWQIAARIHSASSRVEASLKFDITLIGVPPSVYSHDEPWDSYEPIEGRYLDTLVAESESD